MAGEIKSANGARISTSLAKPAIAEGSIISQDDLPLAHRLFGLMGINADASPQELASDAVTDLNRAAFYAVRAGARLIALKAQSAHGEFLPKLADIGIDQRRAQDCMYMARFIAGLPEDQAQTMLRAAKTKVMALAQAEPEVLNDLIQSGEFDSLGALSIRDLRLRLKRQDSEVETLKARLEARTAQHEKLLRTTREQQEAVLVHMPAFAAATRGEALAMTEKMLLCLDELVELTATNLLAERSEPDAASFQRNAAGTLYHALMPIAARAHELLRAIDEHYGDEVTGAVRFEASLIKSEAAIYQQRRTALVDQHRNEREARVVERHNEANKRKRGRPRKVK